MEKKQKIYVFLGLMGSGKNYRAEVFVDRGYNQFAFADTLRKLYSITEKNRIFA